MELGAASVGKVALTTAVVWVSALVVGAAAVGSLETDIAALRAVAMSNPTFDQSWVGDDPCYLWKGVSCNDSRVTGLSLPDSNLRGPIPNELGGLTSLRVLILKGNKLSGSIPEELGSLTSLQTLSLEYNQLSGLIPSELGSLTSLETLSLISNRLRGSIPVELASLTSLQKLFLAINELSGSIPVELASLTSLQTLWLYGNKLSGPIPVELGSLATLQDLSLSENELIGSIPTELASLRSLRTLRLGYNQLSGSIPEELSSLGSLESLSLSSNDLSGSIPKKLGSLTSLQHLYLDSNRLSGSIPKDLGSLTSLRSLNLMSNQLSGTIPKELGSLTALYLFFLGDNQLRGPIPKELDQLPDSVSLGCIARLTSKELNHLCTATLKDGMPRYNLEECESKCLPASPKAVAAYLWLTWLGIAAFMLISVLLVSWRCRPPVGEDPGDVNVGVTKIGICKYAWGLLSLGFILLDVITNFQTMRALRESWSVYVVAFLIVWQHLISGLMLYMQCVRKQSWPLASGLCTVPTKWAWDWRRCVVGSKGNNTVAVEGRGIRKASILNLFLLPLSLVYVVLLDVLSLLSLKIGFQFKVGLEWVNLQHYWASRELTDALFQALPQAIFLTVLVFNRIDSRKSKISITTSQFVLSVSSSLGSIIAVLAMALWEARMERRSVIPGLWDQFTRILPVVRDDDNGCKPVSEFTTVMP